MSNWNPDDEDLTPLDEYLEYFPHVHLEGEDEDDNYEPLPYEDWEKLEEAVAAEIQSRKLQKRPSTQEDIQTPKRTKRNRRGNNER